LGKTSLLRFKTAYLAIDPLRAAVQQAGNNGFVINDDSHLGIIKR